MYLFSLRIGLFWKNVSGGFFDGKQFRKQKSPFAINGTSDILGVVSGRFVAIEVKVAGGKPRLEQEAFIKKVLELGGVAFVARSVEEVKSNLEAFGLLGEEQRRARATLK